MKDFINWTVDFEIKYAMIIAVINVLEAIEAWKSALLKGVYR